jgi:hypothetical protein
MDLERPKKYIRIRSFEDTNINILNKSFVSLKNKENIYFL